MNPLVTVGLPVYNGEKYLSQAIESILCQTYRHFELVISDNASSDGTRDICLGFAAEDSRIHYIRQDMNNGVVSNSNAVCRYARGEYFRWASDDDYTTPDHLEKCVAVLESHPESVAAYTRTVWLEGDTQTERSEGLDIDSHSPVDRFRNCLLQMGRCNVPYGLIRTHALNATRLFGLYVGSDVDLMLELSLYGTFVEIPEPLFFRRLHSSAASQMDEDGLHQHYFPGEEGQLRWDAWIRLRQRLRSVWRAPLPWQQKLRAIAIVSKHFYWDRRLWMAELAAALPFRRRQATAGRTRSSATGTNAADLRSTSGDWLAREARESCEPSHTVGSK